MALRTHGVNSPLYRSRIHSRSALSPWCPTRRRADVLTAGWRSPSSRRMVLTCSTVLESRSPSRSRPGQPAFGESVSKRGEDAAHALAGLMEFPCPERPCLKELQDERESTRNLALSPSEGVASLAGRTRPAARGAGMNRAARPFSALGVAGLTLAVLMLACSSSGSSGPSPKANTSVASPTKTGPGGLSIVALGDSDTTGAGDPTGKGWVGRYADLVAHTTGLHVEATNLAVDGKTSDQLLAEVRSDQTARQAVSSADIVLIGIGGADLNAGD